MGLVDCNVNSGNAPTTRTQCAAQAAGIAMLALQ
jgi:hypothetical protein